MAIQRNISAILFVVTFATHVSAQTTFDLAVVDGTTGARLATGETRLEVEGREVKLDVAGKRATFILSALPVRANVTADVGSPYVSRQIVVQQDAFTKPRSFLFAVDKVPERFTKLYLLNGVRKLDRNEVDKALALFEIAVNDDKRKQKPDLDDYEAILRFNHARSLQQACLSLSYATCEDAEKRLGEIASEMSDRSKAGVYESNSVNKKLVDDALEDLKRRALRNEYAEVIKQVNSGDPALAQKQLEGLVSGREREPARFSAVGLSGKRLQSDLDFAVTLQRESVAKTPR